MPRRLKQQSLLRVGSSRFARRDAEEPRVETIDVVDEPAASGRHLADGVRVGIEVGVDVPSARRDLRRAVALGHHQLPHRVGGGRTGKSTVEADDGDLRAHFE